MKYKCKRIFMFLLCAVILFGAVTFRVPYEDVEARTISDIEDDIDYYNDLLVELQSELKKIANSISNLENQSGETAALLAQYQAEIDALEAEISINTSIMESYNIRRSQVTTEIAVVKEDYEYRVSMYKKLMQFIYENGQTNAFELFFSSGNIADYLTRRDHFNDIMNAANDLIKDIQISISDLELLNDELEAAQSKYEGYLNDLNASVSEKEAKVKEFETLAESLNLNADELSQQYKDKNTKIKEIKNKISALKDELDEAIQSAKAFIWPVKTSSYRVTSWYGWRGDPFGSSATEYHKGIDIACSKGTPIVAVKDGVVTRASWNGGYGNCVVIYHGNGISSLYAHCDNATKTRPIYEVKVGDTVKAGQVIAYVGTTGRSTGYHLHFGVIDTNTYTSLGGNYVNPDDHLPDGYYTKKHNK